MNSQRNWALCEGRTSQSPKASPKQSEPKTMFAPKPLDSQSWATAKPSRVFFKVPPDVPPDRFSKVAVSRCIRFCRCVLTKMFLSSLLMPPLSNVFSIFPRCILPDPSFPLHSHKCPFQMPLANATIKCFPWCLIPYLSNAFTQMPPLRCLTPECLLQYALSHMPHQKHILPDTIKRLRFRARETEKQKGRQRENARANNRNIGKTTTNILQSMLTK